MLGVIRTTWPLLLGIMLLLVGNGMQGTLLGIRGGIEQFTTDRMSLVMAAYFAGFLLGSRVVPGLIRSVGHVRVFAALGSLISAVLILYAAWPDWVVWTLLRVVIGFAFSGVYITSESWLNASSTNQTRGQALSLYMIVQMLGIIAAQAMVNIGDPGGYLLFVIPSVLVSLAFTPILLSAQPAPAFGEINRMTIAELYRASPLGCVGIFLMGGVFSALFGMSSVWGTEAGLRVRDISAFVAAIYVGGLLVQFPIGWLSDRMDRRVLILALTVIGALTIGATLMVQPGIWGLILAAAVVGGVANPVYALLLAYTNDYLDASEMAAASAGLLFLNGIGAMAGPLLVGQMMRRMGPDGFWIFILLLLIGLAAYAAWRMTRRVSAAPEAGSFAVISPAATTIAVEVVLESGTEAGDIASAQPDEPSTAGSLSELPGAEIDRLDLAPPPEPDDPSDDPPPATSDQPGEQPAERTGTTGEPPAESGIPDDPPR